MHTVAEILKHLPVVRLDKLPAPTYAGKHREFKGVALGVESMKRHMTDEGWQIIAGLCHAGYIPAGHKLLYDKTDVEAILAHFDPSVCVVQDKREWNFGPEDFRDKLAGFTNIKALAERPDIFKLTILKDAHQRPAYHREAAAEMGCHAWIHYYNLQIVEKLAPFIRPMHAIRTYHTVDADIVPKFRLHRGGCLLSGALDHCYPLRKRLVQGVQKLPLTTHLNHPGYHRKGCATPAFLKALSNYKVAICTASVFGYVLRKIIEATACGCIVVTDLPHDEKIPGIDENLVCVPPTITTQEMAVVLRDLFNNYNVERQRLLARQAQQLYDYRVVGLKLAADIENLRSSYVSH